MYKPIATGKYHVFTNVMKKSFYLKRHSKLLWYFDMESSYDSFTHKALWTGMDSHSMASISHVNNFVYGTRYLKNKYHTNYNAR